MRTALIMLFAYASCKIQRARVLGAVQIIFTFLALTLPCTTHAQQNSEYTIKSAFILNFLKFTELPIKNQDSLLLCIYEKSDAVNAAKILSEKRVGQRSISVKSITKGEDVKSCDAIYIPFSEIQVIQSILNSTIGHSVLTIGEDLDFLSNGGMIAMISQDNKIKFAISGKNAQSEKISFSAKLMALAVSTDR